MARLACIHKNSHSAASVFHLHIFPKDGRMIKISPIRVVIYEKPFLPVHILCMYQGHRMNR